MLRGSAMRIGCTIAAGLAAWLAASASSSLGATAPPSLWDGANPFACELQFVGEGTAFPHPDADPFCVDFDKRRQNVSQLGVVDFLSKEPARVAAASPKCFYFQSDHWRGSLVQGDPATKTYEWDGHYFFDKATGDGGVWVTNFNSAGQTYDPSGLPGMPADYGRFFGPGTGGSVTHDSVPVEARCVELARRNPGSVYGAARPRPGCFAPGGGVTRRRLGRVRLGDSESRVRDLLGDPPRVKRGFLRYCLNDGTSYLVGEPDDRSGELGSAKRAPTIMLYSDSPSFYRWGISPGSTLRSLRRSWPRSRLRMRLGRERVYAPTSRADEVIAGVGRGRVRWIAVYDRRGVGTALRSLLHRTSD